MKLAELIKNQKTIKGIFGPLDWEVKGLSCDSKKTGQDFVFVAIRGTNCDGHKFIEEAISSGVKAVVVDASFSYRGNNKVTILKSRDTRESLAELANVFWGYPSRRLRVIGVTGTNGKTTITYLIEAILKEAGFEPAVIGTINYRYKNELIASSNTTPGILELNEMFSKMLKQGVTHVVMEVSSHALAQKRVQGIKFDSAIFTNLTQDHLDYHQDMEDYFSCKASLFEMLDDNALAIINLDDPYGRRLIHLSRGKIVSYGLDPAACVRACNIQANPVGTKFCLEYNKQRMLFTSNLIGRHNVYNILASVSYALKKQVDPRRIQVAIQNFTTVPGRLQAIPNQKGINVFVDYAHTDDALKNVILSLREIVQGRIIVVFGCGGNRDKEKRPKMGKVVTELADYAVITSDNPRFEEPEDIIGQIVKGIEKENYCLIPDRLEAIRQALKLARPGDCVLVAGKGHEAYQVIKEKKIPFDDREVIKSCLQSQS